MKFGVFSEFTNIVYIKIQANDRVFGLKQIWNGYTSAIMLKAHNKSAIIYKM